MSWALAARGWHGVPSPTPAPSVLLPPLSELGPLPLPSHPKGNTPTAASFPALQNARGAANTRLLFPFAPGEGQSCGGDGWEQDQGWEPDQDQSSLLSPGELSANGQEELCLPYLSSQLDLNHAGFSP